MLSHLFSFISWADFVLPQQQQLFLEKLTYLWSFTSGGVNLDGIIRLPFRIMFTPLYALGADFVSYVFIASILLFSWYSFAMFAKHILQVHQRSARYAAATIFVINPIFLGNFAKIGLQLAVASLLLTIVFLQKYSSSGKRGFLLASALLIIMSLIHPFTFIVNLVTSIIYVTTNTLRTGKIAFSKMSIDFLIVLAITALSAAYFLVPLANLGNLQKEQLSAQTDNSADFSALVSIANTSDLNEGLAQSKSVFVDFEFYNDSYKPVFFASSLGLLLLGMIALRSSYAKFGKQKRFSIIIMLYSLVALLILSDVSTSGVERLVKDTTLLPGGWAFRSPLKWQLYIPLVLASIAGILLGKIRAGALKMSLMALAVILVLQNGYVFTQVYSNLLTSENKGHFASLAEVEFDKTNLLYIRDDQCLDFLKINRDYSAELNAVLASKSVFVTRINAENIRNYDVSKYDMVLSCHNHESKILNEFTQVSELNERFTLLTKDAPGSYISSASSVLKIDNGDISQKTQLLNDSTYFTTAPEENISGEYYSLFTDLATGNFNEGISSESQLSRSWNNSSVLVAEDPDTTIDINGQKISINSATVVDRLPDSASREIPIDSGTDFSITYTNSRYDFDNIIDNASFESGPWQNRVSDCYNYDNDPRINMDISSDANDGESSLSLNSQRHIACTSTQNLLGVNENSLYYLSFDFKSESNANARYFIGLSGTGESSSISQTLQPEDTGWNSYNVFIPVSEGIDLARLIIYALPGDDSGSEVLFDNFFLTEIPANLDQYHLYSSDDSYSAPELSFENINPTHSEVSIINVDKPFYIVHKDSYHSGWSLIDSRGDIIDDTGNENFRVNNHFNAWLIEPSTLCDSRQLCTENSDGSWNIDLDIEFVPQRSFRKGLTISTITIVGLLGYYPLARIHKRLKPGWQDV